MLPRALFELEVPEIFDGLIPSRRLLYSRERAKVAAVSYDDRVDPVGACVGMKGNRIHGIVRELRNESIDVINYTNNTQLFIQRALSPAKITSIKFDETNKRAEVYLKPSEVSLGLVRAGTILSSPASSRLLKLMFTANRKERTRKM
jgi:N utilization substance protein A